MIDIIQSPTHSSNYGDGRGGPGENRGRSYLIMHGTGIRPGVSAAAEIKYLQKKGVGVSYHYYVTKAGEVHQFVPTDARAWHAGGSGWRDDKDLNDLSVGIALESSNSFSEVYPGVQWDAARELTEMMMRQYSIPVSGVLSHREISVPPGRKVDPVNFPMDSFRLAVVGPRRIPLYDERNVYLGEVSLVEGRKAYIPDEVLASICTGG